jgi:hypothetical protein
MLINHDVGSRGFCVVPGIHKLNFRMPPGMIDGYKYGEYIVQPITKAGDVVLFSKGTVHGAMAWNDENAQRRCALYRFALAMMAYGRSYFGSDKGGGTMMTWPPKFYDRLNEAQRATLEPPCASRLDWPNKRVDGSVESTWLRDVFGMKYF